MVDLATRLISSLKENCFMMYYQDEDTEYKNRLAKLSRKVADCRTYEEAAHKEN